MKILSAAAAAGLARRGKPIYVGGCTAEPSAILHAVAAEPQLWEGVHLYGTFIPGVNNLDYTGLGALEKVSCLFPTAALRSGINTKLLQIIPHTYYQWCGYLQNECNIDLAYFQVSLPDQHGQVSLGLTADFIPALLNTRCKFIGIINPNMPFLSSSVLLPQDRFEAFVESDTALPEFDAGKPDATTRRIAHYVKGLLRDGDVLQLGIGKLQQALLPSLSEFKNIGLHGGMISESVPELLEQGILSKGVTTGVALGESSFYAESSRFDNIRFQPVTVTHHPSVLSRIARFVAINSVLEVDLQARVNAEYIAGQQVTALGGMPDFIRGARSSSGGRSILALPSTARNTTISRIVASLPERQPVSIPRTDVQFIVTECGVADLRNANLNEVADRLVAIAHPKFRDTLQSEISRR